MQFSLLRKDSFLLGLIIGFILPAFFFGFLYLLDIFVFKYFSSHIVTLPGYLFLLSFVANLYPIKYYFVNLKNEKTGRGLLLITFAEIMLYFLFLQHLEL